MVSCGAPEALKLTRIPTSFGMGIEPAASTPMWLSRTIVSFAATFRMLMPAPLLPTITFPSIVVDGAPLIEIPSTPFPTRTVPVGSVPIRLPCTMFPDVVELPIVIPLPFDEMTFPAPGTLPPIRLSCDPLEPVSMKMPSPFSSGSVPDAARPIQLPWMTLSVPSRTRIPAVPLPERRLRAAAVVPPMVQPVQPLHATPYRPFGRAIIPVGSVPK